MEITIGFTENNMAFFTQLSTIFCQEISIPCERRVLNYAYGNMVIGSRVVPHPKAVQPGHVGEVPIESQ